MRVKLFFIFLMMFMGSVLIQAIAWGQSVPLMIPHSGTVSSGGTPFNGPGQFKFAITNGATSPTCFWVNNTGGGVHTNCEPATAVTIPVSNGQYSVKLGDTSLTNMQGIAASTFNSATTFLSIWFNDGVTGFQQLSPDRQLVSVPYAFHSSQSDTVSLATGIITIVQDGGVVPAGSFSAVRANCPTGYIAIGGGVDPSNVFTTVVTESTPIGSTFIGPFSPRPLGAASGQYGAPTAWQGAIRNNDTIGNSFTVIAICTK